MKRILMVLPYVPYPLNSGGAVRSYNLLSHLAKTHEVALVCLVKNKEEYKNAELLSRTFRLSVYPCARPKKPFEAGVVWQYIRSLVPYVVARNTSAEALRTITQLLAQEQFDVIHAETLYTMQNIPDTKVPIVLLEHTFEYGVYSHMIKVSPWWRRIIMIFEKWRLKRWSQNVWQRAKKVLAVSTEDAKHIESLSKYPIQVEISPSGASDEMFVKKDWHRARSHTCRLFFAGNFQWEQNKEAATYLVENIWPQLDHTKYTLTLAGDHIPAKWKCFAPGEKDMVLLYQSHDVIVAPIYGPGGTRLKLLSAMAHKLPIITTPVGATGLHLADGESIMIAHDVAGFVRAIERIATDHVYANTIANAAYEIAKEHFSWHMITQKLIQTYETLS